MNKSLIKRFVRVIFFVMTVHVSLLSFLPLPAQAALGDFIYTWGEEYNFQYPAGIAIDSEDNVYVTDRINNRVRVFSNTGTLLRQWGSTGTGNGQFRRLATNAPFGIALDANDNVYVADPGNYRIQVFTKTGTFLRTWGSYGTDDGKFNYPCGIAVGPSGNVYVTDYYTNRVQIFSNTGTFLKKYQRSRQFDFFFPTGIAVDSYENAYILDVGPRVLIFNSDGTRKNLVEVPDNALYGVTVNRSGNFYVVGYLADTIWRFSATGLFLGGFGGPGTGNGQFSTPFAAATDSSENVYVTDIGNNRVQVFDHTGSFLRKWDTSSSGEGLFYMPRAATVASNGRVLVADSGNHRVQVFSNTGVFLQRWGELGAGEGMFNYPSGIFATSSGTVYVADTNNHRVQVFTDTGSFLRTWGTYGTADGQFIYPNGLTEDPSGNVYVADTNNHRIQVFDVSGTFLRKWGSSGAGTGQFNNPTGLASDSNGNIYVADQYNHRVQVFTSAGKFLRMWGSYGVSDGTFNYPNGITVDSSGNVYVSDTYNSRIQVFSNTGTFLGKWGASGVNDGQLKYPMGLSVDATGKVYIADSYNHRIQVFEGFITDAIAPVTTVAIIGATEHNGWYQFGISINLAATDAGSGVKEIHYTVDGGTEVVVTGSSASVSFTTDGSHTVSYYAVDNAANTETMHSVTVNIDKTPPTIEAATTPSPNANGWNNTDVMVTFTCNDTLSGVASCPSPVIVTTEGANQIATGTAVDFAGNTATASVILNIDKTPPTIEATTTSPPNPNGWNNADVMVTFTCNDTLSGVASCPSPVTVTSEGANQIATGTTVDGAGNTATASVTLNIDKAQPTITITGVSNGATYTLGAVPVPGYTATDNLSGVAVQSAALTGGDANNVGVYA